MNNKTSQPEQYTSDKLLNYHAAVAVAERMEQQNYLTPKDKRKILTALAHKYGLSSGSIFRV